jgi:hypothetical protein
MCCRFHINADFWETGIGGLFPQGGKVRRWRASATTVGGPKLRSGVKNPTGTWRMRAPSGVAMSQLPSLPRRRVPDARTPDAGTAFRPATKVARH